MSEYRIARIDTEIHDVLNAAAEAEEEGSRFPGMTYEQGILTYHRWVTGETDEHPMDN